MSTNQKLTCGTVDDMTHMWHPLNNLIQYKYQRKALDKHDTTSNSNEAKR